MLDVSQSDITPWLIGVGVIVLLAAIVVGIIAYSRQQNGKKMLRLKCRRLEM